MTPSELTKLLEGIIVVGGVGSVFYAVFKSRTTKDIIANQTTLIDTLKKRIDAAIDENKELRQLHIANEKSIAELRGQVSVYKELPLKELADSMQQIASTQDKILSQLKKNTTKQVVNEQSVGHQTIGK